MQVELSNYEIETLSSWHREMQWECAKKEQYLDADDHKKRADELAAMLQAPNYEVSPPR